MLEREVGGRGEVTWFWVDCLRARASLSQAFVHPLVLPLKGEVIACFGYVVKENRTFGKDFL
jgi:hypothetical protein